jgi:molybdopterin converting factor small subunit
MSGLPRPTEQPRGTAQGQGGDAFNQLVNMRNQIDEMLKGMEGYPRPKVDQVTGKMTEMELQPDELSPAEFQSANAITEEDEMISDEDIDAVLGAAPEEAPVDEAHGVSFSSGTITPGKLGDNEGSRGRFRKGGVDESKKIGSLIEENKKLTKKLNETKKFKESVSTLVEQYKSALEKYRNQLKEMAVFNTNLAHVNNLLVNEGLALTQDDKINIINEFKKVDSIAESQKRYKSFLSEMKESKKTLTESIEGKVSASIQPSSKQKLDEVVEKTAYANDKHIQKMKNLIEYVENRGKKIIK